MIFIIIITIVFTYAIIAGTFLHLLIHLDIGVCVLEEGKDYSAPIIISIIWPISIFFFVGYYAGKYIFNQIIKRIGYS